MPVKKRKALVVLYTGGGKGKTTAALGIILRAWGRDMKVCMLSFIKAETSNYGEERAARIAKNARARKGSFASLVETPGGCL